MRLICNVPRIADEGAIPEPVPMIRTVSPGARGTAGPVQITVSVIEFWTDATVIELTLTNTADVEADVFAGLADATLTDQAGKTLAVRSVRSEFPERIPAKGAVTAKLSFDGLHPGRAGS